MVIGQRLHFPPWLYDGALEESTRPCCVDSARKVSISRVMLVNAEPEDATFKGTWTRIKSQATIAFFPEPQASLAFFSMSRIIELRVESSGLRGAANLGSMDKSVGWHETAGHVPTSNVVKH